MIQVYTGDGKGKTTASLGLLIRNAGHGQRSCLIQFMKKGYDYGELKILRQIKNLELFLFGTPELVDPVNPKPIDLAEADKALKKCQQVLACNKYNLIVLDEINVAVKWGLISLKDQMKLTEISTESEVIMTGRYAEPKLLERADLVTIMKSYKHYFDKGIPARKGIEF